MGLKANSIEIASCQAKEVGPRLIKAFNTADQKNGESKYQGLYSLGLGAFKIINRSAHSFPRPLIEWLKKTQYKPSILLTAG